MQNRWLPLPSTRRVHNARSTGSFSLSKVGNFSFDKNGSTMTNAVHETRLQEPVNVHDIDNGDYGLYDYDVMLTDSGEILPNVDPLQLALPTPGARVSCGVNLKELHTGVIVSS